MSYAKHDFTVEYLNEHKPNDSMLIARFVEIRDGGKCPLILCKCSCGGYSIVQLGNFLSGHAKSCGCKKKRVAVNRKFSPYVKKIYQAYCSMMQRCYKPESASYKNYGARGVVVCEEWRNDYQKFLDWALANGWKEGLHLDKDIKGNGLLYSPDTCCFVTAKINYNNTRRNKKYVYDGESYSIAQLSELTGKPASSLNLRIKTFGMSVKDAVESKVKSRRRITSLILA